MGAHLTVRFMAPHANQLLLRISMGFCRKELYTTLLCFFKCLVKGSLLLYSAFSNVSLRGHFFSTAVKFPSEFLNSA